MRDHEPAGMNREFLDIGAGDEAADVRDYAGEDVVPPPKTWEERVREAGFEYSPNARIRWDGDDRESATLIKAGRANWTRVATRIAALVGATAAHWNNRGIAQTYLEQIEAAERSFNKAIALGRPAADVARADSNLERLDKLVADQ